MGPNPLKQVDRVEHWAYPTDLVQAKEGPTQKHPSHFGIANQKAKDQRSTTRGKCLAHSFSEG